MMDSSAWGVCATLMLNSLLFFLLFALFYVYRQVRSPTVDAPNVSKVAIPESEWSFFPLLTHIYRLNPSQISDLCGVSSLLFLQLHRYILIFLTILTFVAFLVLIPVYTGGDSEVLNDLNHVSFAHIQGNEGLVVAPLLCLVLFTGIGQWVLYAYFTYSQQGKACIQFINREKESPRCKL